MTAVRSEAARAASLHVISNLPDQLGMVGQMPECQVALVAEQAPVPSGRVAMVDVHPAHAIVPAADIAALGVCRRFGLLSGQAISPHRVCYVRVLWSPSIAAIVATPSLVTVLQAILTHAKVGARSAVRFAKALGHIVEPEFEDWKRLFTARAGFLFHNRKTVAYCLSVVEQ